MRARGGTGQMCASFETAFCITGCHLFCLKNMFLWHSVPFRVLMCWKPALTSVSMGTQGLQALSYLTVKCCY